MAKSNKIWLIVIIAVVAFFLFIYPNWVKRVVNYTIPAEQTPIDLDDVAEELTEEELEYYSNRLTFEVNFYANADNTGIILQEIDLDYFTDASLTHTYAISTGMQYVGAEYESTFQRVLDVENYVVEDLYYYDTTATNGDVITWSGNKVATTLKRSTKLIVKIDNKPYLLQMTGTKNNASWDILNLFTIYFDYSDLFADIMQAVKTNSKGYGDYYLKVDLSNYFSIYAYDDASNAFILTENVAKTVIIESVLKFHYYERGAQTASDSLFGQIGLDKEYCERYCNLSFDANDGIGVMDTINVKEGTNVTIPNSVMTKLGYVFTGWNTQADGNGTNIAVDSVLILNESTMLYAQWEKDTYTIIFDANGGSGTMENQIFTDGVPQALSSCTYTKSGYRFNRWICYPYSLYDNEIITITMEGIVDGSLRYSLDSESFIMHTNFIGGVKEIMLFALWIIDCEYAGNYISNNTSFTVSESAITSFTYNGETFTASDWQDYEFVAINSGVGIAFNTTNYSVMIELLFTNGSLNNDSVIIVHTMTSPPTMLVNETITKIS